MVADRSRRAHPARGFGDCGRVRAPSAPIVEKRGHLRYNLLSMQSQATTTSGPPEGAVVVATDLSASGGEAVAQAHTWATRLGTPLIVCHVVPRLDAIQPLMPHLSAPIRDPVQTSAVVEAVRAQVSDRLGLEPGDYHISIEGGSAHAAVVRLADAIRPRLVVVGASEKGSVARFMLGSTAEQIVRHGSCPVLVARAGGGEGPVIGATDLSDPAAHAVQVAAEEATRRGVPLFLVHALEINGSTLVAALEPTAALDEGTAKAAHAAAAEVLRSLSERFAPGAQCVVVDGDASDVVPQVAEEISASLVVVATHGHTGLERIALGSTATSILRYAGCSVLVVRRPHDDP